jgi:hypothetical protein
MPRYVIYTLLCMMALVLTACGGQTSGVDSSGVWRGQLSGPGGALPFSLALTQQESNVLGSFTLQVPNAPSGALPMSGTLIGNQLNLSAGVTSNLSITALIDGNNMTGTSTINVPGEPAITLNLTATR